ncbi:MULTISPECIES: hypothetical protein [Pseudomonadota]|nr:hypothetical protein [Escherichia coli]MCG2596084.1 hypothetical protein [Achromobacter sp.]MCG2601485.1 hypothetical protein [Achromobacter sp.]
MNKVLSPRKLTTTPGNAVAASRATAPIGASVTACPVFEFSLNHIPVVDAAMQARLDAAARQPRKGRRYPEIADILDA